jgi:hypothetical protein
MRIAQRYSHLNGEEFLLVRRPGILEEIEQAVRAIDAEAHRTKVSQEKTMPGKLLYSPTDLNKAFRNYFAEGWKSSVYSYCVTTDRHLLERTATLPLDEQKQVFRDAGIEQPIEAFKQTDFVKDRVAVEVQFGKYSFVAYDLFVKHMLFYGGGVIDVGVEILPTRDMLRDPEGGRRMSTGIAYFEGEVYNVLRHGRSNPPVPLVILGVEP